MTPVTTNHCISICLSVRPPPPLSLSLSLSLSVSECVCMCVCVCVCVCVSMCVSVCLCVLMCIYSFSRMKNYFTPFPFLSQVQFPVTSDYRRYHFSKQNNKKLQTYRSCSLATPHPFQLLKEQSKTKNIRGNYSSLSCQLHIYSSSQKHRQTNNAQGNCEHNAGSGQAIYTLYSASNK